MVLKQLSELYVVLHKTDAKGTEFSVQKVHLNNSHTREAVCAKILQLKIQFENSKTLLLNYLLII